VVPETDNVWDIIKIFYVDTKNDSNMNMISFKKSVSGQVLLPASFVSGFYPRTKKILRKFDITSNIESWEAI
jgi:hypothetical protein